MILTILIFNGCFDTLNQESKIERELLVGEANESYHKKADKLYKEANYREALKYEFKQLEEDLKYYKDISAEISVDYNNIGLNYYKLQEYNQSIFYYKKAIKIDNIVLDLDNYERGVTYYNIASSYDTIKEYDKALKYYLKSLKIKPKLEDKLITYQDVAKIYHRKKEYNKAMLYYSNAFILYKKSKQPDRAIGVNILENIQQLEKEER